MDEISQTLKWGARSGYMARGVVYLVIGIFAVLAAVGAGETEDTQGALKKLFAQPLGGVMLTIVAVGLLAFSLWRFAQALGDYDRHGTSAKGLLVRFFLFCSGVIHMALTVFAASIVFKLGLESDGGGGGSDPTSGWLSSLFGASWGRWVALSAACIPLGVGAAHIVKGWRAGFEKYLNLDDDIQKVVTPICSFGLIARGMIFVVLAVLAFYGGGIYDAEDAPGLEDALSFIQQMPFGAALLLLTALGLVAFAFYSFVESAYRRIGTAQAGLD